MNVNWALSGLMAVSCCKVRVGELSNLNKIAVTMQHAAAKEIGQRNINTRPCKEAPDSALLSKLELLPSSHYIKTHTGRQGGGEDLCHWALWK